LKTSGTVRIGDQSYEVEGGSWFDRQWASTQLAYNQVGWDWFAI
jgi:predicted secreted hydrolase